jgi:hypothetical protein
MRAEPLGNAAVPYMVMLMIMTLLTLMVSCALL